MLELNPKEIAAILLHLIERTPDRPTLFEIAEGENRANKLRAKENSLKVTATRWYKSHKIQEGIKYYANFLEEIKAKAVQDYINSSAGETETREPAKAKPEPEKVNFLNPDEFLKFANSQANEIQDEKERREYLKMIANLMNYKEGDQEQTDIQRFYTPVTCLDCAIYNKCKGCKGCSPSGDTTI